MKSFLFLTLASVLVLTITCRTAKTQGFSLVLDAEVEQMVRSLAAPLFSAAGLSTDPAEIHIIKDPRINAFVANGQRIFLHTGLILEAKSLDEISGVIAHEIGHIVGGHLVRTREALRSATTLGVVTAVLGGVTAGISNKTVGGAIISSAKSLTYHSVLDYSKSQEFAADLAATRLLREQKLSGRGLIAMLERLLDKGEITNSYKNIYVSTHPLTAKRISILRELIEKSPYYDVKTLSDKQKTLERVQAKILGFTDPKRALIIYDNNNQSFSARFARAIAYHSLGQSEKSAQKIRGLIQENPDDAFLHELLGQVLFESGAGLQAISPYETAVLLAPKEPLIRIGLAKVQISVNQPLLTRSGIKHLKIALNLKPDIITGWRHLAIAYGREKQMGQSSLASAELALRLGQKKDAYQHAIRAKKILPIGQPARIRAQDILRMTGGKEVLE